MDPLQVLLLQISSKLNDSDLSSLKFLCMNNVGKRKMDGVKSATDLFSLLKERMEISHGNLDYLVELLLSIKRDDLAKDVKNFNLTNPALSVPVAESVALDETFLVICENVGKEWKMLIRRLGVSDVMMDRIVDAHRSNMKEQLFQSLRTWKNNMGDRATVPALLEALLSCKLKLVHDKVVEHLNLVQI
ncbi:hypothetical protein GDO86_018271 [Hymenochirus boettgeri]|uniref:Uncharacterized protein n=1 Tax=Hymenochirus boettgeri TaxID=247094 RepID=A0A8T2I953_9PIPI|nr:hypothetical protein GDO86_018271 [Hymenochirus boettgeri]